MISVRENKVHRLKVTLRDVRPTVWRRIEISSTASLADLHDAIQAVMPWLDMHLHEFTIAGATYGPLDDDAPEDCIDEQSVTLTHAVPAGARFTYVYDFGDNWIHDIDCEDIVDAEPGLSYPRCVTGAGAVPPDDVGGTDIYADFVVAMADPNHPEHQQWAEWIGSAWDPGRFSINEANEALRELNVRS